MPTLHLYISKASECNITQFMACKFDKNYQVLALSGEPSQEQLFQAWDDIDTEYIDLSGTPVPELPLMKQIKAMECRNEFVRVCLELQEQSIIRTREPYYRALKGLEENARKLTWNNDVDDFLKQIHRAKTSEKRYHHEVERKNKELDELKAELSKIKTPTNSRMLFLQLVNNVERLGYRVDFEKTMVERFALMVKSYHDILEQQQNKIAHN